MKRHLWLYRILVIVITIPSLLRPIRVRMCVSHGKGTEEMGKISEHARMHIFTEYALSINMMMIMIADMCSPIFTTTMSTHEGPPMFFFPR